MARSRWKFNKRQSVTAVTCDGHPYEVYAIESNFSHRAPDLWVILQAHTLASVFTDNAVIVPYHLVRENSFFKQ